MPFKNKKILVVEDDDISQFLIKKMLENLSFDVHITSNGIEAIDILANNNFDIILMDIEMPVISGFETVRRIQKGNLNDIAKNTPIIGISANPFDDDKELYYSQGLRDYITKPISQEDLLLKINNILT
jgi:CheY-like chemotaxis protein